MTRARTGVILLLDHAYHQRDRQRQHVAEHDPRERGQAVVLLGLQYQPGGIGGVVGKE